MHVLMCTPRVLYWQWEQFMELGKDIETSVIEDKVAAMKPNQCATLVYTVSNLYQMLFLLVLRYYVVFLSSLAPLANLKE